MSGDTCAARTDDLLAAAALAKYIYIVDKIDWCSNASAVNDTNSRLFSPASIYKPALELPLFSEFEDAVRGVFG